MITLSRTVQTIATDIVNDAVTALVLLSQGAYTWAPVHPALALLRYEDDRTDVHAVIGGQYGPDGMTFRCACGFETGLTRSHIDASAEIISHAMHTCAVCQEDKPSRVACGPSAGQLDVFPRCSGCAF